MQTQIISQREYKNELEQDIDGSVIFDGDGDGVGAAAIWLMANPGKYVAVTNQQKSKRDLVKEASIAIPSEYLARKKVAVLDISAEQNMADLELLVERGVRIDFIDHHTPSETKLHEDIANYSRPDSREISTASLAYNALEEKLSKGEKRKAAQLAVLGLANDGKGRAARKLFGGTMGKDEMEKLLYFGKVLNYAACLGNTLDFAEVLKGLSEFENIFVYFDNSRVKEVAEEMESSLTEFETRISPLPADKTTVYFFPQETEKDTVLGLASYSNYLNSRAEENPEQHYLGILRTDTGKTRFSVRGPEALKLTEFLAQAYGARALGRETAAGFDTERPVEEVELVEKLGGIQNGKRNEI